MDIIHVLSGIGASFPSSSDSCSQRDHPRGPKIVPKVSNNDIVDDHPKGYPQLAAFVNSNQNLLITRKFGYLRSRVLLYRQDELSVLERQLIMLDDDDSEKRQLALHSRKHDECTDKDPIYSRKVLIQKIDDKLKQYGMRTTTSLGSGLSTFAHNGDRRYCEQHKNLCLA